MSELHVPLTTVTEVKRHPNADKLDVAIIQGWQVCVGRDSMQAGDSVVYVPPDSVVPDEWARTWGILRDEADGKVVDYRGKDGRVKAIKLRGEPSFGFAVPFTGETYDALNRVSGPPPLMRIGDNVAAIYGITKYVPPLRDWSGGNKDHRPGASNGMPEDPRFARFTDIVNLRHYPAMFDGAAVVVTEKIHGTNSRVGVIDGERVAGSHRVQRMSPSQSYDRDAAKRYDALYNAWYAALPRWKRWLYDRALFVSYPRLPRGDIQRKDSTYWLPWQISGVEVMLEALGQQYKQVILYGEIYGPSIQALGYGVEVGKVEYRAFDLVLDGTYQDYRTFAALCSTFGVPMAPLLATGELSYDEIKALSEGATTLNDGSHIREGVVVRAVTETVDPRIGRMVAKLVADSFLVAKGDAAEDLSNDAAEEAVA